MFGASADSTLSPRRISRPMLGCVLVMGCAVAASATPTPLLNFQMNEGTGTTVSTGTAANATRTSPPTWSQNTPAGGGGWSLDFGSAASNVVRLEMATPASVKSLKSFTITGWLNCRDLNTGGGGNRILVNVKPGGTVAGVGEGIDLAFRDDGSLSLGVNQWNDWGGVRSRGGKITVDPGAPYSNWRFFAVTYNSLVSEVKFYFGSNTDAAELDITRNYYAGPVGHNAGVALTIGNMNLDNRYSGTNQTFRGLIDQIRVYGSTTDDAGALSLNDIKTVQNPMVLPANGLLYEEYTGLAEGDPISLLVNHPSFPNNPTTTVVRPTFDGFLNTTKDQFGARMSGWIKAPTTGNYTFWITTDDAGELRLSTDANPDNKRMIAYLPDWAGYNEWEKSFPNVGVTQKSAPIPLVANQYYYIEALMKENAGGDHIKVQWQIPDASTPESPIPNIRLFTAPPAGALPSSYSLYEPNTSNKKATLGWKREEGVGTLYLESEGTKAMTIQNGTATFPRSIFFGGNFPTDPNNNDLGFRWERPTVGDYGALFLETQGGRWAYRVQSGSEMEPHTEFNRLVRISGPDATDGTSMWSSFGSMHYMDGLLFERWRQGMPAGQYHAVYSKQDAYKLSYQNVLTVNGVASTSYTNLYAGEIALQGKDLANRDAKLWLDGRGLRYEAPDGQGGTLVTLIHGGGLTAPVVRAEDYVSTMKWKVTPDYVFEKGYKLRSLEETERFVKEKKHLPEIPSAKEMAAKGMNLTDMNLNLLKKVEELTLHMIALDKELKSQRKSNGRLEREVKALRAERGN